MNPSNLPSLNVGNTPLRRDDSTLQKLSPLGAAILFVRSASPCFAIETNSSSIGADPETRFIQGPNVSLISSPLQRRLAFVQQTTSLAHLASLFLGFPAEVTSLLGGVASIAVAGEVIRALSQYVSFSRVAPTEIENKGTEQNRERQKAGSLARGAKNNSALRMALVASGLILLKPVNAKPISEKETRSPSASAISPSLAISAISQSPLKTALPQKSTLNLYLNSSARTENRSRLSLNTSRANLNATVSSLNTMAIKKTTKSTLNLTGASVNTSALYFTTASTTQNISKSSISTPLSSLDIRGQAPRSMPFNVTGEKSTTSPITISSVDELAKIGRDPAYPLNASYVQTADIDARTLRHCVGENASFTGAYDGRSHKISNLNISLFRSLDKNAILQNIQIIDSVLTTNRVNMPVGLLVCKVSNSTIDNIYIRNSSVLSSGFYIETGLITGSNDAGIFMNIVVESSNVTSMGDISNTGVAAGLATNLNMRNLHMREVIVTTSGKFSHAGIGVGEYQRGYEIEGFEAERCSVLTQGKFTYAGIVFGNADIWRLFTSKVVNANITKCEVRSTGEESHSGLVGGLFFAEMENVNVRESVVSTSGAQAHAGILMGDGAGVAKNITLENNRVQTFGMSAGAKLEAGIQARKAIEFTVTNVNLANNTILMLNPPNFSSDIPASFLLNVNAAKSGIPAMAIISGAGIAAIGLAAFGFYQWYLSHVAENERKAEAIKAEAKAEAMKAEAMKAEAMKVEAIKAEAIKVERIRQETISAGIEVERWINVGIEAEGEEKAKEWIRLGVENEPWLNSSEIWAEAQGKARANVRSVYPQLELGSKACRLEMAQYWIVLQAEIRAKLSTKAHNKSGSDINIVTDKSEDANKRVQQWLNKQSAVPLLEGSLESNLFESTVSANAIDLNEEAVLLTTGNLWLDNRLKDFDL